MSGVQVNDVPNQVNVNPRDLNRVDVVEQPVYVEISVGGPQGPPGATLDVNTVPALVSYVHTQDAVSSTWTISHNLKFRPNATVITSGGHTVEGDTAHPTSNTMILTFSSSFSGTAYLS